MTDGVETLDTRLVGTLDPGVQAMIEDFVEMCKPVESLPILVMRDKATDAIFVEVHLLADSLVPAATVDVPLDPEDSADYRANREVVEDHVAFAKMKDDAKNARAFSNLVCEFTRAFNEDHPLKIIGGQHRFTAIQEALEGGVNEHHGVKLYFALDNEQRLDVQLISNTNIAVSTDLFDRMTETLAGPELRQWCQKVGLLKDGEDFADRRARGNPITVRAARTFIINYYRGTDIEPKKFDSSATTPVILKSGVQVEEWTELKLQRPTLWEDANLQLAGAEFSQLVEAQRKRFTTAAGKLKPGAADSAEKAMNYAVLSAWAYVSGVLSKNKTRQKRHFDLRTAEGKDPLNAGALAKGRHKTDPENYRGLGYRTDAKERSRLVELFYLQAEDGSKITPAMVDLAIKKAVAKEALLEVSKASEKANP
ncbi:hypothetical protein NVV95_17970 [Herbiconiux sp. CPCC 205716]|uniref:ParB/Sulfiredoxin domain-containing protein n=1 Tax=Herbiconiux gentiana TaxID=2970912 RepID=A0ABT2GJV6_9MICO|nr:hypothetical protein [Herbiconiux gentiana]MCS5716438.1 hypothetical protein [Herbiconiux gentiana]